MAANQFKVPKSQWRKWPDQARDTFNWLYDVMMSSPDLFRHPKAIKQNPRHWKTTAWNTAWLAADAVKYHLPKKPGRKIAAESGASLH